LVTIFLVYASDARHLDVRKALASGGALEDPAIGMVAAAFAGYLGDLDLADAGVIDIAQGEDMGCGC